MEENFTLSNKGLKNLDLVEGELKSYSKTLLYLDLSQNCLE